MSEQHDPGAAPPEPAAGAAATEVAAASPVGLASPEESTAEPPVEQAPTEAAPAPAEAPAEPALKPHTDEPGLLQATEEKAPEGEKPAEGAPPEAVESALYELVVPENFEVVREGIEEARQVFADGKVPKETAEKLWGMHLGALQQYADRTLQAQHDAFAETRRGWRNQIASDPELGGAGFETNKATANRMLQKFVPEQHRAEFDQYLSTTGATDHPALFRFLLNLAKWADEPQGGPPPNPAPLPARTAMGRAPQGARGGRAGFYDQPRGGSRS